MGQVCVSEVVRVRRPEEGRVVVDEGRSAVSMYGFEWPRGPRILNAGGGGGRRVWGGVSCPLQFGERTELFSRVRAWLCAAQYTGYSITVCAAFRDSVAKVS